MAEWPSNADPRGRILFESSRRSGMELNFAPQALRESADAARFYEEAQPGLGRAFLLESEAGMQTIMAALTVGASKQLPQKRNSRLHFGASEMSALFNTLSIKLTGEIRDDVVTLDNITLVASRLGRTL